MLTKKKTQLEKSEIRFADREKEVLVNAMAMLCSLLGRGAMFWLKQCHGAYLVSFHPDRPPLRQGAVYFCGICE